MLENKTDKKPNKLSLFVQKYRNIYPLTICFPLIILLIFLLKYEVIETELAQYQEIVIALFILSIPMISYLVIVIIRYIFQLAIAYSKIEDLTRTFEMLPMYKHGEINRTVIIETDGSCKISTIYEFIGKKGIIEERIFRHIPSIGTKFKDLEYEIKKPSIPEGKDFIITKEIVTEDKLELCGRFSPGLNEGESAKILIEESIKNFYHMNEEEIKEKIKRGNWKFTKPYEYVSFLVLYPTERLKIKVTFPQKYKIAGKEFYDVTVGRGEMRNWGEYGKIKKNNYFSTKKQSISLDIKKPEVGHSYILKWIPEGEKS
ncbi:MAG: hypothetical protein KAT49_03770 [Methanomicrobia archaeon]|nr:hypothetical protein [Methanomicrobia archaeon]